MSTAAEVEANLRMALAEVGADHLLLGTREVGKWGRPAARWRAGTTSDPVASRIAWRAGALVRLQAGWPVRCRVCFDEASHAYGAGLPEPPECEAFGRLIEDCGRPR